VIFIQILRGEEKKGVRVQTCKAEENVFVVDTRHDEDGTSSPWFRSRRKGFPGFGGHVEGVQFADSTGGRATSMNVDSVL
jgi:hypothetical protein